MFDIHFFPIFFLNQYLVESMDVDPMGKRTNSSLCFLPKQSSQSGNSPPAVRPKLRRIKALDLQIDQLLKSQRGFCFVSYLLYWLEWHSFT